MHEECGIFKQRTNVCSVCDHVKTNSGAFTDQTSKGPPVSTQGKYHYLGWHKKNFLNGRVHVVKKRKLADIIAFVLALSHTRRHTQRET